MGLHPFFGSIERALLFCNLLFQAATVWIVYDMCRRLADGRKIVGAVCALFVAAAPLFVGIGHGYFVENFQLLAVAWLWRLAVISPEISRPDLTISLAMAFVLGMTAKVSTPLFAGPPVLLAALGASGVLLVRPAKSRTYKPLTRVFLLTALALIAALTCAWYAHNFKTLLTYVKLPLTTAFWGSFDPFPTKFWRWLGLLRISFLPGIMLYASLTAIAIAFLQVWRTRHFEKDRELIALGGIVSVVLTLTIYSMAPTEEFRYVLPVLPAVVVILAWALHNVPSQLVLIFCLVTLGSGFAVQGKALGIIPRSLNDNYYLRPLSADLTLSRELAALVKFTSTPETDNRSQICAVDYNWLNCHLLNFYASKEKVLNGGFLPSYAANGLGFGESDLDKALKYIDQIKPKFIVSVREDLQPAPDFVNLVNLRLLAHLRADPRYEQVEFPSCLGVIVFKRVVLACPAEIDFRGKGNSDRFLVSGFSGQEEWGRWTDGKVAEVDCCLPKEAAKRPRAIKLYAAGYVGRGAKQQVEISINGKNAGAYSFSGQPSEVEVRIPKGEDTDLRITLDIKNPSSPLSNGLSDDPRNLGLGVVWMKFLK